MADPSDAKSIRVVNTTRRLVNITDLSEDALFTLLRELPVSSQAERQRLISIERLVGLVRDAQTTRPTPNAVPLLASRQLLYDRGVAPYGERSARATSLSGDGGSAEESRPPIRKELWYDVPPKRAAGLPFENWAVGVAQEEAVALDGYIVELRKLTRGPSEAMLTRDLAPDVVSAPRLRALQRYAHAYGTKGLDALAAVCRSFLHGLELATKSHPRLTENRLRAADTESVLWADSSQAALLGNALVALYDFSGSAAGVIVASALLRTAAAAVETLDAEEAAAASTDDATPSDGPSLADEIDVGNAPTASVARTRAVDAAAPAVRERYAKGLASALRIVQTALGITNPTVAGIPLGANSQIGGLGGNKVLIAALSPGDSKSQEAAQQVITMLRMSQALSRQARRDTSKELRRMVHARLLLTIAEQKLGSDRAAMVIDFLSANPTGHSPNEPSSVLAAIKATAKTSPAGKGDASTVEREYNNRQENWKAEADNQCPHVKLVRRLRAATSVDKQQSIIRELKDWRAKSDARKGGFEWERCKNCNFRLICPHVLEMYGLRQKHAAYEVVRRALAKFTDPTELSGESGFTAAYYCRICSEELFTRAIGDGGDDAIERIERAAEATDGDLRSWLWGKVARTVNAAGSRPILRFSPAVDPKRFAQETVEACLNLAVADASGGRGSSSRGIARVRGNAEAQEHLMRLFAVVYAYAYFFSLAVATRLGKQGTSDGEDLTVKVAVEGLPERAAPEKMARALLSHLVSNDGGLISRIPGVTVEQVANQFKSAYARILAARGNQVLVSHDSTRMFTSDVVLLNPYYKMLATAMVVAFEPRSSAAVNRSKDNHVETFKAVMGNDLDFFLRESFDKKYAPFVASILNNRGGIEPPTGVDPLWAYNISALQLFKAAWGTRPGRERDALKRQVKTILDSPTREILADMPASVTCRGELPMGGRTGRSALLDVVWVGGREKRGKAGRPNLARRGAVKRNASRNSSLSDFIVDAGARTGAPELAQIYRDAVALLVHYATEVRGPEDWEDYHKLAAAARARYYQFHRQRTLMTLPVYVGRLPPGARTFRSDPVRITAVYDQEGEKHTWKRHVFTATSSSGSAPKERVLTVGEIVKLTEEALKKNEPSPVAGMVFSDWECSTCGVRHSQTDSLDEAKAQRSLLAREEIDSFYTMYETRCPEEGLHVFDAENKPSAQGESRCAKCNAPAGLLTPTERRRRKKEARAYYDKYRATYKASMKANKEAAAQMLSAANAANKPRISQTQGKPDAVFERDYDALLKLAALAEVPIRALEAAGAAEGRSVEDVEEGVAPPEPPTRLDDPRILATDNMVRTLGSRYCMYYFRAKNPTGQTAGSVPVHSAWAVEMSKALTPAQVSKLLEPAKLDVDSMYFAPVRASMAAAQEAVAAAPVGEKREAEEAKWAAALMQFGIETFCRVALKLADGGAATFAKEAVRRAVRAELLFAKPDKSKFQFAIFGDSDEIRGSADDTSQDDFRRYGEAGTGAEDVLAENIKRQKAGDEEYSNPFSHQHVDIDTATARTNLDL